MFINITITISITYALKQLTLFLWNTAKVNIPCLCIYDYNYKYNYNCKYNSLTTHKLKLNCFLRNAIFGRLEFSSSGNLINKVKHFEMERGDHVYI